MKRMGKQILIILGVILALLVTITFIFVIINALYSSIYYHVNLNADKVFSNWLYIFQLLSYFFGLVSFISVIITVFKYFSDKNRQTSHERVNKLTRSIHVINAFENNIVDSMEQSEQNVKYKNGIKYDKDSVLHEAFKNMKKSVMKHSHLQNNFDEIKISDLDQNIQDKIYKYNRFNNVIDTINNLEQWSLYLEEDLVYYKLVYRETHHDYISFLNEFRDVLKEATSKDDKYQACHDVYQKMKESEQR